VFIQYLDALNYNFAAIEEPFEPYAFSAMQKIMQLYKIPIVLDESFMMVRDFDRLDKHDNFIPNIRVSKLGGLLRTLSAVALSNQNQVPIILGSLVGETSILSRLWLVVAGHFGPNLYAAEGAYSTHLLEADITEFPIIVEPPRGDKCPGNNYEVSRPRH